jgi:phage terminase large subunit-like protein
MGCDGAPQLEGKRWYAGLDMAISQDFTALVLVSEADDDGIHDVIPYFWIPEKTVSKKSEHENSNIYKWVEDGLIFTTEGNVTDHTEVANFILELRQEFEIIKLVADPAYAIGTMNTLNDNGLLTEGLPQNPTRLTPPTSMLYGLVLQGKIRHGGNPVLRWMLSNCLLKENSAGLIKITKESSIKRIDGIDALIDALAPFNIKEEDEGGFLCMTWEYGDK